MIYKVLHIINSMAPGGAEVLLCNSLYAGGLCDYTENYLAFFTTPSYLMDNLDERVKVFNLDYKGVQDFLRLLKSIKKIIVDNEINIVHSHLNPASWYTHLACPKNVKQVHTIHTTYSMDKGNDAYKIWMEKYVYLLKKDTNIILLSDFTKEDFLKTVPFKGKAFVLNNFVKDLYFDILPIAKKEPGRPLKLIAIGSLQPLKNFEYLLEAFSYLKNYNVTLSIYGGGNQETYQKTIDQKGLKVSMMGHFQQLEMVINNYDIFIMPSKFEGFPLSVFEAMAAGIPLMLSDIAPLKSIVKDNALYFKLDNAASLADMLINILINNTNLKPMADKAQLYARQTVRRSIYIDKLLKIYDKVLN